jgi:Putative zinc-finger/Protein of unknown function (DUF2889)
MVSCEEIRRELSNYIDDDITPGLRAQIDEHLSHCKCCTVLTDTLRKTLLIVGDDRVFEIPLGYSERLHKALDERLGILG